MSAINSQCIGVIGAGVMGRGIAQLFAQAGHQVICHDADHSAAKKALEEIRAQWGRMLEKGRLGPEQVKQAGECLIAGDSLEALANCDVVIEAIVERLDAKKELFAELELIVRPEAILASNTSSLMISAIAADCRHPERIAGLHFFNPVPLMKIVEVIAAVRTAPVVIGRLESLVASTGHRAVKAADQPGFLVNHAGRGLYTEGLRLLEERICDHRGIDRVLREGLGFNMGPFELMDLTGLDVSGHVMASIYEQFQHEPRFRPSALVPPRMAAGLYGRKTSEGWYRYEEGKVVRPADNPPKDLSFDGAVWIDPDAENASDLREKLAVSGVTVTESPEGAGLLIIQPWGESASSVCARLGLDAKRCVAIDPMTGLSGHITIMITAATEPTVRDLAKALFSGDGVSVTVIQDSPGFICQRVLATIVNIASDIAQRGIATVSDIDEAVRVGLGYPYGPLAWGDRIGAKRLMKILENIYSERQDPRYRPSPWLLHRAQLGLSLSHMATPLESP